MTGSWAPEKPVRMTRVEPGKFELNLELPAWRKFQWTVRAPQGEAVFGEGPLKFETRPGEQTQTYQPRTLSRNGIVRQGEQALVRMWAPQARRVDLVVWDEQGRRPSFTPLVQDEQGFWQGQGTWGNWEGKGYAFQITTPEGGRQLRADPYARRLQGQLRGVDDLYLNPTTGAEVNKFAAGAVRFQRFEVQRQPDADRVVLRLYDGSGEPLDRRALEKRLGTQHQSLLDRFQSGLGWQHHVAADGGIELVRQGSDAWTTVLNRPEALSGLTYRFEVYRDGELQETAANDPYGARLADVNSQRWGIVTEVPYKWKHEPPKIDPNKAVVYQLHVGSFAGEAKNHRRSTFQDLIDRLDYFKELGVTHLELLPVNPFEGGRDWGYIGTNSQAVAEQYGFEDEDGRWVSGPEALKRFVDEAHGKGLAVINDVVYNHWGGDHNPLWDADGKANSWYNWGEGVKHTPWGPMPAYNQAPVRQFIIDSAQAQLDEFRFDGLRFDFTHPMHDQKEGGGDQGWTLLREITRQARFHHPDVALAAEEFPNHPIVTTPPAQGGAGFSTMWNTEFQHRLVHDGWNPSILQQAVAGRYTDVDKFMHHLVNHPGFAHPTQSTTVISNHDEVGNADRTINVARAHQTAAPANDWQRRVARTTFGIGMLSPGTPIFFQGEEALAENTFKWGVPSTWDTGKPDPEHLSFCKKAIALRHSSPALGADVPAKRVYSHNLDSVLAFSRSKGDEEFLVVASLNQKPLAGYQLPVTGQWEQVLSSEGDHPLQDGKLDLPAGGLLVYRRRGVGAAAGSGSSSNVATSGGQSSLLFKGQGPAQPTPRLT